VCGGSKDLLFSQALLRYVWLMVWAVCLSSVTLLHLRQRFQLFDNIWTPPYSSGTRTVCIKILGKNLKGLLGTVQVMTNWCFQPIYILLCFENGTRYGHSYNGRRIGTRMQSVEWCHFQWPSISPHLDIKFTIFWTSNNVDVWCWIDVTIFSIII